MGQSFGMRQSLAPIALKEWAVTVDALRRGELVFLMRKGGIAEETKHFQVHESFFLFPAYEHQKKELLKPAYAKNIEDTLEEAQQAKPGHVRITTFAEVAADLELFDEAAVRRLYPLHIWTEHFAYDRLRWKPKHPLHVLLLRVYRLELPLEVPVLPDYSGCKSWIRLQFELPSLYLVPVLDERQFERKKHEVLEALGRA